MNKIYFDGCSWTKGIELKNPLEERYSKLICDEIGAEEINFAMGGGSNDRIIRNLVVENNIEEYDYAVIQMTFPARTEYWEGKWRRINPSNQQPIIKEHLAGNISAEEMCIFQEFDDASNFSFTKWLSDIEGRIDMFSTKFNRGQHMDNSFKFKHNDFWSYYYTKICNLKYFHVKEKIQYETIKSYCKSKGVPLILCSINEWSKLNFDYLMKVKRKHRAECAHPNSEGHRIIAKDILSLLTKHK